MSGPQLPAWGPQLVVRLRLDDGSFVEGQVSAIGSETLAARFDPRCSLALPLGTRLPIVLSGSGPQTVHEARVMQRSTHDGWLEYGFQAAGAGSFTATGDRNRRAAYRVAVSEKQPILVQLGPFGEGAAFEPVLARLTDVSRLGVGVAIPDEAEDHLFACERLRLRFDLPGDDAPFDIVGMVRQRRFQGVYLRYGVEFDGRRTEGFGEQEERVNRFVMRRQLDVIRRANRWNRVS